MATPVAPTTTSTQQATPASPATSPSTVPASPTSDQTLTETQQQRDLEKQAVQNKRSLTSYGGVRDEWKNGSKLKALLWLLLCIILIGLILGGLPAFIWFLVRFEDYHSHD
jgi:hypothetical protein